MDSPFTRLDLVGLPTAGVPICVCLRDIGRVIIATITMERVYISYVGKDADVTKVIVAIQSSFRSEMCFRHLSIDALWAGKRVYRSTWLHIVCVCKVRQGPRHKHHCGNEHDEHSFREFHTSKNLSVRNRRTSSKGRANQTCFAPKGLEICPFSRKNKLISATSLFRLTDVFSSEFPKSEFPKPDSPQKPGDHGNPRRNASLFLWGFLPPLPSVAFSLARSAKSVEPPRSLQQFLPIICRNHIVYPPFILSGVDLRNASGFSIP